MILAVGDDADYTKDKLKRANCRSSSFGGEIHINKRVNAFLIGHENDAFQQQRPVRVGTAHHI